MNIYSVEAQKTKQGASYHWSYMYSCHADISVLSFSPSPWLLCYSVLAFSERHPVSGVMSPVTEANLAFGPSDDSDSWGTEDPRMVYDSKDELYYMFYTAYNGKRCECVLY